MSDLDRVRRFALSLPGATEEPHFEMSSFRVRGKIFATVPPDGDYLHVFVDEGESRAAAAEDPAAFGLLLWGQRLRGLRVRINAAPDNRVQELIEESWRRKAPARLRAEWEQAQARLTPEATGGSKRVRHGIAHTRPRSEDGTGKQ